jgi:hypothetical protein
MTTLTLKSGFPVQQPTHRTTDSAGLTREVVDVLLLSETEKDRFLAELSAVARQIFRGYDLAFLNHYFQASGLISAKVQLFRETSGALVGFNIFRLFEQEIDGRIEASFRALAGLLPAYRGRDSILAFCFAQSIPYKLRHPFRRLSYLLCANHPSSYNVVARYAGEFWPRHDIETPAHKFRFMKKLCATSDIEFGHDDLDYVVRHGRTTIQNDNEAKSWAASRNPHIRHYLTMNPDYEKGCGLICLVPLTGLNILLSGIRFAGRKIRRLIGA